MRPSSRARGLIIWFLHRNHWTSGPIRILKNVKKLIVEMFFPLSFFLCLLATVPQEPDPFYYGEWQMLCWGYPGAGWRGGSRSPWVTAEVASAMATRYVLAHWPCDHVDIIHISWAHGGPSQTWGGGTLYGPSLGFTSPLGWRTGIIREANNSDTRLSGFESWIIHSLAVWPWARNFASLGPSVNKE